MAVEIVKRSYVAFARGDLDGVWPTCIRRSSGTRRRAAARRLYRGSTRCAGTSSTRSTRSGGTVHADPDEFLDAGTGVVSAATAASPRRPRKQLDVPFVHIWSMSGDKAIRFRQFLDTAGWVGALRM